MAKAVNSYIMSQTDFFTDFSMSLAGTAADAAAKGEVGRAADVLVLAANGIIFLFDAALCGFLLRTGNAGVRWTPARPRLDGDDTLILSTLSILLIRQAANLIFLHSKCILTLNKLEFGGVLLCLH